MITEGKAVSRDLAVSCDAVIIGSGAGGAVMAAELAAAGRKVVILEEGGYYTRADFSQREDDMFAKIEGGRGFDVTEDLSVNLSYAKCVGGTTVHYWADSYRTPPDRLAQWETDFGIEGFSREELDPIWDRLEKRLSVQPAPDYMVNENARLVEKGAAALGWEVHRTPQAREGCTTSGYCMSGCAYDAKKSMLVTCIPDALEHGADLFADCRATAIEVEGGRAVGVRAEFLDRKTKARRAELRVRARVVILAAGGFGSPVLLLRNRLANSSGQVGKNFYLNPGASVFAFFDHDVRMYRNIPAAVTLSRFRRPRFDEHGRYVEGGYLLMPNGVLHPGTLSALLPGFGKSWRRDIDRLGQLAGTYCILDDENAGEIVLDGQRPVYRYRLRGRDVAKTRDFLRKSAQIFLAAGAREVVIPDGRGMRIRDPAQIESAVANADLRPASIILAGPHPLGTCRMHADPARGVVKSTCETHDVRNLYVCDASVVPTSVSVDPSFTIMAFAARTAQRLKERWPG